MTKTVATAGDYVHNVSLGLKESSISVVLFLLWASLSLNMQVNVFPLVKGSAHSDNMNALHRVKINLLMF